MSSMQSSDASESWKKFLNVNSLRTNLLLASLYLAAFELLQDSVIDRIKSFLVQYGEESSPEYREVLKLHKSPTQASLLWLHEMGAISQDDINHFDKIRLHRNEIAHCLPNFLGDVNHEINLDLFGEIRTLLRKIEVWWIQQFDLPCNPDYDGKEVADEDISPGPVIMLDILVQIAIEGKSPVNPSKSNT